LNAVTHEYFNTIGSRILRGRGFSASEPEPVAIVNETLASEIWPDRGPLDRCINLGGEAKCYRVVGVVKDARRFTVVPEEPTMQVYIPLSQNEFSYPPTALLVRTNTAPDKVLPHVARLVQRIAPEDAEALVRPLETLIDPQVRPWRTAGSLFTVYGCFALAVSIIGLYGTLVYIARQKRRQIAICLALGAQRQTVLVQISRFGILISGLGIIFGCITGLVAARHAAALLFGISGREAILIAYTGLCLVIVCTVASVVSVWRFTGMVPAAMLRD